MNALLQRVAADIQQRELLLRGQKILAAVSGGVDSLVLLHVLGLLARQQRWQLHVAHFNHQLRGRASAADEKLVRAAAGKMALPYVTESGAVAGYAREAKISTEMAARKWRHEFLARVARQQQIPVVALAHHADDQVELFFLRLLRGAGGEGLAGMKWRSTSPADSKLTLVRPLLGCSKAELLAWARAEKIHFREDATNASPDFLRNRIRHELLPLLREKYQPGLTKTVLRLMDITGAEAEYVGAAARQAVANRRPRSPGAFAGLPVAVQRQALQQQLLARGLVSDFDLVEQLRAAPGVFVSVSPALSVARDAAGALVCREQVTEQFNPDELKLNVSGKSGRVTFAGLEFRWLGKKFSGRRGPAASQTEVFDAGQVGDDIILRHWRAGDRFQPIGQKSAAKLQDLFVNAKIPAARRRTLVLATTAAGQIFWVQGLRMSEPFKLTPQTRRQLTWKWSAVDLSV